MFPRNWKSYFVSSDYKRIGQKNLPQDFLEKGSFQDSRNISHSRSWLVLLWITTIAIAGALGSFLSIYRCDATCKSTSTSSVPDARKDFLYNRQCIYLLMPAATETVETFFQYNSSFASPPKDSSSVEPIWDSLIPSKWSTFAK